MYYSRISEKLVKEYLNQFPSIGIMGPRQSGKSTMVKKLLGEKYTYVSFDDFEIKDLFYSDPKKFISRYNNRIIFDEVQYIPELFPLLKQAIDEDRMNYGKFVITGSGQFLMSKHISESLAGRIGLIPLLPLQFEENKAKNRDSQILLGSYPELVVRNYTGYQAWYNSYIETYLQKDLRQMVNVSDIHAFTQFLRMLAINISQVLNLSSFSRDIGVSVATLKRWLSVLENSYIIFLLRPYYRNFGKRLIKSPKIYFYDTGLVSYLSGISTIEQWEKGILHGPLFENFIIADIYKQILHSGLNCNMYFYRTSHGDEVDLIVEQGMKVDMIEIKASVTYRSGFHKTLENYDFGKSKKIVVYQGEDAEKTEGIYAYNYRSFLLEHLKSFRSVS